MKRVKWFLFGIAVALQCGVALAGEPDAQKKENPLIGRLGAPVVEIDAQKKESPNGRQAAGTAGELVRGWLSWIGIVPDAQKKE